jgi:diguanylate cyclase (GGDEF)-like protein
MTDEADGSGFVPPLDTPGAADAALDPHLAEMLHDIVHRAEPGGEELLAGLKRLEKTYGDDVYAELLFLLSHLRFSADEARGHWDRILEHRATMGERLGSPVDLRVALIHYFLEVNRQLDSPKVIELRLFEQTQASAYRDELTGLYNYRVFREHLKQEVRRCERYGAAITVVMVDIDDFKAFNDRNGHEAGNDALVTIAGLLSRSLRKSDVAARYGGEEFVLVLPSTSKVSGRQVAERARAAVEAEAFSPHGGRPGQRLTVSAGVATFPADALDAADLVRCSDRALYVAKARGKNLVHFYGEDRRSYRRLEVEMNGELSTAAADLRDLTTVNVSERGFLILVDRMLPVGSLADVTLRLPDDRGTVRTTGRVVRVEETGSGRFRAAVRVLEIEASHRMRLLGFIRGGAGNATEE